ARWPGGVHVAGWPDLGMQRRLVAQFRRWASRPAGLRHPRVPSGNLMSVQSVCLGWHWEPYAYSKTADDTDGAPVKPLPREVADLARAAVAEACGRDSAEAATYAPDAAIVNLYAPGAHLGLHQDGEEPSDAPVVTLCIGDSCVFRFAGVGRRTAPFTDLKLRSGDLLVFGEPNRRIYHGVPKVLDGTAPGGNLATASSGLRTLEPSTAESIAAAARPTGLVSVATTSPSVPPQTASSPPPNNRHKPPPSRPQPRAPVTAPDRNHPP